MQGDENKGGPPNRNASQTSDASKKPAKEEEIKTVIFVNDKGTAKMLEVKTGISDYDNIEILSEIADSTEVVTGPFLVVSKRLKEGEKIRPAEKKEEPKKD
jgi:HlyD family secretion protein